MSGRLRGLSDLAWLDEAGTAIGTTLDLERTAQELADFTVPRLAGYAAVDMLESVLSGEEGSGAATFPLTRAVAVAFVDELRALEPTPIGEPVSTEALYIQKCIASHEPVLVPRIRRWEYPLIAPTPHAGEVLRSAGVHSYLAVPLISRGVLIGTADFVRGRNQPPFTRRDLALALQLASKAAVFVDNARLYGRERERVVTLQRSLLPRSTPSTPGLDVSTTYTPPTDPGGVGGDWFDVIALPGGRTALLVGDVMAHGLPAAATMGRLRAVARTLMALDIAPERLLARLDLAARDLEEDQIATCLCAVHDPADGSYTVASAGHPPPLLIGPDGVAGYPDVPTGAPLGAGVIPYDAVRLPAAAGSRLVLYTDGLIKTRADDVDVQLAWLRRNAEQLTPDLEHLVDAKLDGANRFDDAVLLVTAARPADRTVRIVQWDPPPEDSAAALARRLVRERLADWHLEDLGATAELVTSEFIGNALRYGNGPGRLRLLCADRLVIELSDTGPDLPQIQHATLSDEGGRGLQLVNMLCRRWGSCRTAAGKIVWAELDIPDQPEKRPAQAAGTGGGDADRRCG
ncbi:SpoIIE family protein phosphatase [Kitasatospora sp. RB6PN24]|nr:SpoIIE family protein phosphatase [Kitasatospora humi]MCC9310557.1 SpoIIE family protein phosphatase [Kitasatospora humi]